MKYSKATKFAFIGLFVIIVARSLPRNRHKPGRFVRRIAKGLNEAMQAGC